MYMKFFRVIHNDGWIVDVPLPPQIQSKRTSSRLEDRSAAASHICERFLHELAKNYDDKPPVDTVTWTDLYHVDTTPRTFVRRRVSGKVGHISFGVEMSFDAYDMDRFDTDSDAKDRINRSLHRQLKQKLGTLMRGCETQPHLDQFRIRPVVR